MKGEISKVVKKIIVFCILVLSLSVFPEDYTGNLYYKPKIEPVVSAGPVTAFDLMEESNLDEESLKGIIVAFLPTNTSISINPKYLSTLLNRTFGYVELIVENQQITIRARQIESVRVDTKTLTESEIFEKAVEELKKFYPEEVKFETKNTVGRLVQHDSYSISTTVTTKRSPSVRYTLKRDGRTVGYVTINFEAIYLRNVLTAERKINTGERLTEENTKATYVNIYSLSDLPITQDDLPLTAGKNFVEGEVILKRFTKEVPIIQRNQIVKAYAIIGEVKVSTLAQALEDGREGALIQLRNLDTGKIIKGVVTKDGSVVVLEVK